MNETKTIELREPVKLGDNTYDRLELREPKAGELAKAQTASTPAGQVISLVHQIAKVPMRVAENISQRELTEAADFFASFGQGTPVADSEQS